MTYFENGARVVYLDDNTRKGTVLHSWHTEDGFKHTVKWDDHSVSVHLWIYLISEREISNGE